MIARPVNHGSCIGKNYHIRAGIKSEADPISFDILRTFAAEKPKKGKHPNAAREKAMLESLKLSVEEGKRKLDAKLAAKGAIHADLSNLTPHRFSLAAPRTIQSSSYAVGLSLSLPSDPSLAMAELFSTVAGVTSLIDVALRHSIETFAHGNNSRVFDDFVQRLDRNHEDTTNTLQNQLTSGNAGLHADLTNLTQTSQALLPAQEALRSCLDNLNDAVFTGQSTLNTKLEDISTTLSRISVQNNHLLSSTTVTAPSEGLLAPIIRAELRRVIIPTVQQCFDKYKASPDRQLDDIRTKIDEMAQQLCWRSSGLRRSAKPGQRSTLQEMDMFLEISMDHRHALRDDLNVCDKTKHIAGL
ncbi:MAG: hypothetical protein Q9172_004281 [Xanthocarpia lactea]